MKYDLPVLSVDQQLDRLKALSLHIPDEGFCKEWLRTVGFYKLRQYFGVFITTNAQAEYKFNNGVVFDDITDVYEFDCALRVTVFTAIMGIEVCVKSALNNVMSVREGSHWYLKPDIFRKEFINSTGGGDEDDNCGYTKFIEGFRSECENHKKNNEDSAIKRYCCYYTDPDLPPSWMMLDSLSFGKVSILYQHLSSADYKREIADFFKVHHNLLQSWLRSIGFVRNLCAHHARITYRSIKFPPLLPKRENNKFLAQNDHVDPKRLYLVLCCIQHLSKAVGINDDFSGNLFDIIDYYPSIDLAKLGFTENWRNEKIWANGAE